MYICDPYSTQLFVQYHTRIYILNMADWFCECDIEYHVTRKSDWVRILAKHTTKKQICTKTGWKVNWRTEEKAGLVLITYKPPSKWRGERKWRAKKASRRDILDGEMSSAVAVVGRCVTWTLTLRPSRTTYSVTLIDNLPLQQKHIIKKVTIATHCNLKAARRRASRSSLSLRDPKRTSLQIYHFPQAPPLGFGDPVRVRYFVDCWQFVSIFGHVFTADTQKLLYSSFQSKVWNRR